MKENDKITKLPKRTLSASNYVTPITNQANVAIRLGESFGKDAHDRVWHCADSDWEAKALEYVNLTYGNHYGTRWVNDDDAGTADACRANHPAGRGVANGERPERVSQTISRISPPNPEYAEDPNARLDQVSGEHPSPTPMAALLRLIGGNR